MSIDFSDLAGVFGSLQEVNSAISQLTELSESLYTVKSDPELQMKKVFSEALYQSISNSIKKNQIDIKNRKIFQEFINKLINNSKKIPKITLYVAFEPKMIQIDRLASWLNTNLKPTPVVEIIFKPDLLGGVVLEYNGKYADYSLNKSLSS